MNETMKSAIIADGIVDATEVAEIRADIFADGVVDQEEVKDLFDINDEVSGNDNSEEWTNLMVDAVKNYCLEDENTPGVVDQEEGDFLSDMIEGDGQVDTVEVAVLTMIKNEATAVESTRLQTLIDSHVN